MEKLGNISPGDYEEFLRFQEKQKKAAEKRERKKEEKREAERKEEEEKKETERKKEEEEKKREAEKKKEQEKKKEAEKKKEQEEKKREAEKKKEQEEKREAEKKKEQGEKKRREEDERKGGEEKRKMETKNPEFGEQEKNKGRRDGLYDELMGEEEASFFPVYLSCSSTEEDEATAPKVQSKVTTAPKRKLTFPDPVFGSGPKKASIMEGGKELPPSGRTPTSTTKPQEQYKGPAPSPSPGTTEADKLTRSITDLVRAVHAIAGGLKDIAHSIDRLPVLSPPPPPLSYHKSGSRGGYSQRFDKR